MIEVTVRHNFETGHRLPHLPGKCQSLHGHSWWAAVTVGAPTTGEDGVVVDFGALKKGLRDWIDTNLDHGLMLGHADPLLDYLAAHGKVFEFTPDLGDWPTVENVAALLADVTADVLDNLDNGTGLRVEVIRVVVNETHVNEAAWTA
jgi:6-pyruvoyltetrahydropterin/6-carboxytetrahydropterin synthase